MAKERLGSPRIRAFVALDLPDDVRAALVRWQRRELRDPALRVVSVEKIHLTLAFLGFIPEKRIPEAAAVIGGIEATAPRLELELFPVGKGRSRKRPGLFAIPVRGEEVFALQGELERRLVEQRLYKPERRAFWPHLTVARVRPEAKGSRRPARVERPPGPLPQALRAPFRAVRLTFYRSKTMPQGAEYVPLAQVELPAPSGEAAVR